MDMFKIRASVTPDTEDVQNQLNKVKDLKLTNVTIDFTLIDKQLDTLKSKIQDIFNDVKSPNITQNTNNSNNAIDKAIKQQQDLRKEVKQTAEVVKKAESEKQKAYQETLNKTTLLYADEDSNRAFKKIITSTERTDNAYITTTQEYKWDKDLESYSSGLKTIQVNYEKVRNEAEKARQEIEKAKAKGNEFLSSFDKKTANAFVNADVYKDVRDAIDNLGDSNGIDELTKKMQLLNERVNTMTANVKQTKGLNPLVNARLDMQNMDGVLKKISLDFQALKEQPQAVQNEISKLYASKSLIEGLDNTTVEWSEQYGNLKKNIELVTQSIQNLNKEQRIKEAQNSSLERESVKAERLKNDIAQLTAQMRDFKTQNSKLFASNSKDAETFKNRFIDLQNSIKNATSKDIPNLRKQFSTLKTEINTAGLSGKSFLGVMKDAFRKFTEFYLAGGALINTIRLFKQLVGNVKEVDSAMVGLRKVTDATDQEFNAFLRTAIKNSKELGASLVDMIDSASEFARLGYGLPDATKLAEIANLYKNVGDGINIQDASQAIISTMKAFNMTADQAESIVDKFNYIGNRYAVSSQGIGVALQRSASALASAGNTLDMAVALITAGNNVIQDPEVVGTALKTMSMRIRSTKAELEQLGEETDGVAETVSALRKEILALTKQKVDIQIDENTYKSTYQILKEIAMVKDSMTDMEQATIMEMLFGKRQANVGMSILNSLEDLNNAYIDSANSAGSARREQEEYAKSVQYSLDRLNATMQELSITTLNSNVLKFFIDLAQSGLEAVNALGGLIPVLLGIGTAIAIIKFEGFAYAIRLIIYNIGLLIPALGKATLAIVELNSTALLATGIGAVIIGITAGIIALGKASEESARKIQEAKERISELDAELNKLNSNSADFDTLAKRFDELKNKTSLTTEEQKEFIEIQRQIKEILPEVNGYYDEQGNFILANTANYQSLNEQMREYIRLKREEKAEVVKNVGKSTLDNIKQQQRDLESLTQAYNLQMQGMPSSVAQPHLYSKRDIFKEYNTSDLNELIKSLKKDMEGVYTEISDGIVTLLSDTTIWDEYTVNQRNAIRKVLSELDDEQAIEIFSNLINGTKTAEDTLYSFENKVDNLYSLDKIAKQADNVTDSFTTMRKTALDGINDIVSNANKINDLLNKLNTNGFLTSSEKMSLLNISEDFADVFSDSEALKEKMVQQLKDYEDEYKQTHGVLLKTSESFYSQVLKGDTEKNNKVKQALQTFINDHNLTYQVDLKNYKTVEEAKAKITGELLKKLAGAWSKYIDSTTGILDEKGVMQELANQSKLQSVFTDTWMGKGQVGVLPLEDVLSKKKSSFTSIYTQQNAEILNNLRKTSAEYKSIIDDLSLDLDNLILDPLKLDLDGGSGGSSAKSSAESLKNVWSEYVFNSKQTFKEYYDYLQHLRNLDKLSNEDYYTQLKLLNDKYINALNSLSPNVWDVEEYSQKFSNLEEIFKLARDLANEKISDIEFDLQIGVNLIGEDKMYNQTLEGYKKIEDMLKSMIDEAKAYGLNAHSDYVKELTNQYYSYLQKRYDATVNYYNKQQDLIEDEISAIEKMQDTVLEMIKKELEEQKKLHEQKIDDIKSEFDLRRSLLDDELDNYEYQQQLQEKINAVNSLQNKINLISNDDSNKALLEQYKDELKKAQEDLDDFQYRHNIDVQKEILDEKEKIIVDEHQKQIDLIDSQLEDEVYLREQADLRIKQSGDRLYNDLSAFAKRYGTITKYELDEIWKRYKEVSDKFNINQNGVANTLDILHNKLLDIKDVLDEINNMSLGEFSRTDYGISNYTDKKSADDIMNQMKSNSAQWFQATTQEERDYLARANELLAKELEQLLGTILKKVNGRWYDTKTGTPIYHNGGIVGDKSDENNNGTPLKPNEIHAILEKGEMVISKNGVKNLGSRLPDILYPPVVGGNNGGIAFNNQFYINGNTSEELLNSFKNALKTSQETVIEKICNATGLKVGNMINNANVY